MYEGKQHIPGIGAFKIMLLQSEGLNIFFLHF